MKKDTSALEEYQSWDRPSHFISAPDCQFGHTTLVGKYVISSVGEMPLHNSFRDLGTSLSPDGKFMYIGNGRIYETMVFEWSGELCQEEKCNCGKAMIKNGREFAMRGAMTREQCLENHDELIEVFSHRGPPIANPEN